MKGISRFLPLLFIYLSVPPSGSSRTSVDNLMVSLSGRDGVLFPFFGVLIAGGEIWPASGSNHSMQWELGSRIPLSRVLSETVLQG